MFTTISVLTELKMTILSTKELMKKYYKKRY